MKITECAPKCLEGNTELLATHEFKKKVEYRSCNFCFTMFTTEDKPPIFDENKMKWLICGREYTKEGRLHWQSAVVWINKKTISANAKYFLNAHTETWICSDAYIQKRYCSKGLQSHEEYTEYNKDNYDITGKGLGPNYGKDALVFEYGEMPKRGKRTDLIDLTKSILSGDTTLDEIIVDNPIMYHQYGRTLQNVETLTLRNKFRTEMTTCDWIYGSTNVGKSYHAFKQFFERDGEGFYVRENDGEWWDGYKGQHTVILNDFRGEIPYNQLLKLIDKYPMKVRRRGNEMLPFISKHIIITSSLSPELIYHNRNDEDKIEQLLRRLTIYKLDKRVDDLPLKRIPDDYYNKNSQMNTANA